MLKRWSIRFQKGGADGTGLKLVDLQQPVLIGDLFEEIGRTQLRDLALHRALVERAETDRLFDPED